MTVGHNCAASGGLSRRGPLARLVVAVDQITDELRSIIEYMNTHMSDPVSVMALEVGYFKQDAVELLVPKTYGAEMAEAKAKTGAGANRWSSQAVLDKAESLPSGPAAGDRRPPDSAQQGEWGGGEGRVGRCRVRRVRPLRWGATSLALVALAA